MNKFFTILIFLFWNTVSIAQINFKTETKYFPGEVLVQTKQGYSIQQIVNSFPTSYKVEVVEELSSHMRIWHLKFNDQIISQEDFLQNIIRHPGVRLAQNNHYIEERSTMPNDPNTPANQWHHLNTGQTGGTADADIDSDEAWDITTGGLTVQGDTIVVCIVEGGGANYNHPDLIGNFWRNYGEIPNNSIDDDNNGYVDDVDGWNVGGNNDNHSAGGHGTQCMGMIGAKGDNSVGVVGANWNVKMMLVSGFSTAESSVISAYSYPLKMRKMYNESNGTEGAFVVATSASWGIDQADPSNYPLWCAFYDTLGTYGVLNPGATTNSNFNVDVVGDMPTACASDYMVSVTRTSATDSQAGGYGATTIDFGAPGINVYTTSSSSSYGTTTGTSFSCPLTAGVIALLYSVPCNSFIALAKADPQAAADEVLQALMNGVDQVPSMSGISVTGGRLNAFNSINELLNNCSASNCITPFALDATSIIDTAATLSWDNGGGTDFLLYLRPVGNSTWDSVAVTGTSVLVDTLVGCSDYEFMVRAVCTPDTSAYSPLFTFSTLGCCEIPTGLASLSSTNNSVTINFNSVFAADSYVVYYKPTNETVWMSQNTSSNSSVVISGLDSCTSYELNVETVCDGDSSGVSSSITFNTSGCGLCESTTYCSAGGNDVSDEWIANVTFNTINNTSGADGGYINTGLVTPLYVGQTYNISISPGYSGTTYTEYFMVWADYNQNGVFDVATEEVFDSGSANTTVNGNFVVPTGAVEGYTRLRVAMKYVGTTGSAPIPCGTFGYGEVEDYCIEIIDTATTNSVSEIENGSVIYMIYPNPANNYFNLEIINFKEFEGNKSIELYNSVGQLVLNKTLVGKSTVLNVEELSNGIYYYAIHLDNLQRSGKLIINK